MVFKVILKVVILATLVVVSATSVVIT